jgi:hypothetical protein
MCVGVAARTPFVFTADGPWTASSIMFIPATSLTVPYGPSLSISYTKPSSTQLLLISPTQHAMACVPRSRIAIDLLAVLRLLDRFWDLPLAWVTSVE